MNRQYTPIAQKKSVKEPQQRPIIERHNIYTELLQKCGLAYRHREDLISRGLSEAEIKRLMYKTVPVRAFSYQIARELASQYDLKNIPGFSTKNGSWQMMQREGMFIPMRDKDGYIQGLQIRMDDASKGKCKWFSSTYDENGISATAKWIHVARWNGQTEAVLTEGGMKEDISGYFTEGVCFLGVPGVNCTEGIIPLLRQLNIQKLNIAYDMDRLKNKQVNDAVNTVIKALKAEGIAYQVYEWEPMFKGIDDLLYYQYQNIQLIA